MTRFKRYLLGTGVWCAAEVFFSKISMSFLFGDC